VGSGWAELTGFSSTMTHGTPNDVSFQTQSGTQGTLNVPNLQGAVPNTPSDTVAAARIVWEPTSPAKAPAGAEVLGASYGDAGRYTVTNYLLTPRGPTIWAGALGSDPSRGFIAIQNTARHVNRVIVLPAGTGYTVLTGFSTADASGAPHLVYFRTHSGKLGTINMAKMTIR
jgi:hypothetical protein